MKTSRLGNFLSEFSTAGSGRIFATPAMIALGLALVFLMTGCTFGKKSAITLIKELSKDDASAHLVVNTIYGRIEFTRTNPHLNTQPHALQPDGTISVQGAVLTGGSDTNRTEQLRHLDNILNKPLPPK